MITQDRAYDSGSKYEGNPQFFNGLSTDPEPTDAEWHLINGAQLYLMDTMQVKIWDEANQQWKLQE